MLPVLLAILSFAFGASAVCVPPKHSVEIDKNTVAGKWFVQVEYGTPPVANRRCYSIDLSVSNNKQNAVHTWKVGNNVASLPIPEIDRSNNDAPHSFQAPDGKIELWYLHVDDKTLAAYGCTNGEHAAAAIVTRQQEKDETLVKDIAKLIAKDVALPEETHWIDQTGC